jgi:hypothetical protein
MPLVLTSTKSGVSWNSTVPKMFMMLFLFCFNFKKISYIELFVRGFLSAKKIWYFTTPNSEDSVALKNAFLRVNTLI